MDRVRIEMLPQLTIVEWWRESRRSALADAAGPPDVWRAILAARLGMLLVRAGRRLEGVECRRPVTVPRGLVVEAGGCGE